MDKETKMENEESMTLEKFMVKLDEDYNNVWYAFLDKYFPKKIADYRGSYTITHPWVIFPYCFWEIKYAWQRIFRGWDDRVIWSIDYYLAEMLPIWFEQLKKDKHGIPSMFFTEKDEYVDDRGILCTKEESMNRAEKEYDNILNQIANGFRAYRKIEDECLWKKDKNYKSLYKEFENGFDLFRKYFGTFWD